MNAPPVNNACAHVYIVTCTVRSVIILYRNYALKKKKKIHYRVNFTKTLLNIVTRQRNRAIPIVVVGVDSYNLVEKNILRLSIATTKVHASNCFTVSIIIRVFFTVKSSLCRRFVGPVSAVIKAIKKKIAKIETVR